MYDDAIVCLVFDCVIFVVGTAIESYVRLVCVFC